MIGSSKQDAGYQVTAILQNIESGAVAMFLLEGIAPSVWRNGAANKSLNRNWQARLFLLFFGPVKSVSGQRFHAGLANPVSSSVRVRHEVVIAFVTTE